jgi:hypothetical protein
VIIGNLTALALTTHAIFKSNANDVCRLLFTCLTDLSFHSSPP